MGSHAHSLDNDLTQLKPESKKLGLGLMVLGALAIAGAAGTSFATAQHGQRFFWALLFGVAGYLAISCSALIFILINYMVRAGWITNVRRVLETLAIQIPLLGLLLLPIIIVTALTLSTDHDGHAQPLVYSWAVPSDTPQIHHGGGHEAPEATHEAAPARPETPEPAKTEHADAHAEHAAPEANVVAYPNEQVQPGLSRPYDAIIAEKRTGWLSPTFWALRVIAYLSVLSGVAWYYRRNSIQQDSTGDVDISSKLLQIAGPLLMACGLIVTFIAFDVFMSLDPHWFSTMYGVYFFASGTQAMWSVLALTFIVLQRRGYLAQSISAEHYHDIGKFMWGFVVFFTYIAFSQYMLQWYANMPEETFWYDKRGYSTSHPNGYTPLVLILLIGRFCIPFLGLVSRHVKRSKFGIGFWAVWLLVCFVVDIYLLVMPEFHWADRTGDLLFGLPEILCLAGVGGLWLGNVIRLLASHALRPVRDPRTHESVALQNF